MTVTRTLFVTLDCADPQQLAQFWAAMLGGTIDSTTPNSVGVRSDAARIAAMRVPDYRPPTSPEYDTPIQIQLDLTVDNLEAAEAEAVRFGATPTAFQPAPDDRRVRLDPAGHPFCLTTLIPRDTPAS